MDTRNAAHHAYIFRKHEDEGTSQAVAKFRKSLFVDNLLWNLETNGQLEVDQFDTPDVTYAVLYESEQIVGSFRAIRSDNPYLAEKVFPHLATTRGYPKRQDTWEISRFGIWPTTTQRYTADKLYALMFHFALIRSAKSLVAVTDLVHERYLTRLGIRTRRFGMPHSHSSGSVSRKYQIVAGEIPVQRQEQLRIYNLLAALNGVVINDQTLVFGRQRVQA